LATTVREHDAKRVAPPERAKARYREVDGDKLRATARLGSLAILSFLKDLSALLLDRVPRLGI
jgi:hypothetical protein